jgi:6-pyruvoyltetrahydropterin/6-carboxytetrahydropterin synthase
MINHQSTWPLKTTICKEFTFEAAHLLPHHDGKCRNLHGHTYKVQIYITGTVQVETPPRDLLDNPKEGMVVDFGEVSGAFKEYIFNALDHKFLNDVLPFVTTAENIAAWIFDQMSENLDDEAAWLTKVRVWETKKSFAEVVREG